MAYRKSAFPNYKGEVNTLPSETKPGQSLSVVALFKQFGIKDINKDYEFDLSKNSVDDILNSETMLDAEDVDLADLSEAVGKAKETLKTVEQVIKKNSEKQNKKTAPTDSDVQESSEPAKGASVQAGPAGLEGE